MFLPPEVVRRPGRLNIRVRSVLVVMGTAFEPSPILLTHRPRLWAMTLKGHPGGIRTEAPRGQVVETDAVLQVADDVLDDGMATVIGLELDHVGLAVGDEGVVVVSGEQGQLATRGGLDPPDDEARLGVLFRELYDT